MDPYTLCPCGSGKKLKFCCSDLIGEIEKIHRMIEGDQPRAALRHVEQTLAKQPGRASLLDLQAMLQMSLGEFDAAEATVAEFLKADPQSPSAHAHHAMLLAEQGKSREAVESLQSALERVETNMPQRVLEAIGAVGHALLQDGDIVSARAHLWLYEAIAGDQDHRALELLMRMNQVSGLPLLLRDRLSLKSLPPGHAVEVEMRAIQQLAAAGKWRAAASQCDELLPDHLDEPLFFYNRALLSGYLADRKNFVAGMRLYARQNIPQDDAVEAEAIAQLVDENNNDQSVSTVRISFAIADEDTLAEKLIGSPQVVPYHMRPEDVEALEGPKPRAQYVLTDRVAPDDLENMTRDQVPRLLGFLSHYGRQTDRAERLVMVADRDGDLDPTIETLKSICGDALGEKIEEEEIGESGSDPALSWRWHMPPETPQARRRELLTEERKEALLNRWPDSPRAALGGKTPREAAGDPELRLPLMASVLLLEQGTANVGYTETFDQLRNELGLPPRETIPASGANVRDVPVVRIERIDLAGLSDPDLSTLYKRAILVNATGALSAIVREGLSRPQFAEQVPFETLYEQLFSLAPESEEAMQVLDEARSWARSSGQSCGRWDLLELQLHISDNNGEGANQVLRHLSQEHMEEPEIAEQVYQLLYMIGAIPDSAAGTPGAAPGPVPGAAAPAPAAAASQSAIWTPDGGESSSGGPSKLWTPD